MFYTTNQIIESVEARTLAPTGQPTYQNSDYVRFANEELQIKIVPDIMTIREDFFLRVLNYSITNAQASYTLPERTLGNTLKDLFYIDQNGNRYPISRVNINDIPLNTAATIYPQTFYMKGDQVVLVPTPTATVGTMEAWYYERPSELVLTEACGQITSIALNTPLAGQTTYTVNADVSSYATLDFVSGTSPFRDYSIDVTPVSATSTTVVVTNTDVDSESGSLLPVVGDWICEAQTSPIPMVPQEFHPLLAELVAGRVVQGLGDAQKLEAINANVGMMRQNMLNMIANRIEQKQEVIVNRYGLTRASGYGWTIWNR